MTFDSVHDPTHLYFVTAATCGWKKLFNDPHYAQIVLNSLSWLRNEERLLLFAFVLMPSHFHVIIKPINRTIGETLDNFASFTAHALLHQLRADGRTKLLEFFQQQRRDRRHKHSIWQDVQAKNVFSVDFPAQKLEYIHQNPIARGQNPNMDRADYKYSSACFYDHGIEPVIKIDDIRGYLSNAAGDGGKSQ
jgi:putative transposase